MGSRTQLGIMNQRKLSDAVGCDLLQETRHLVLLCATSWSRTWPTRQLVSVCRVDMLPDGFTWIYCAMYIAQGLTVTM